MSDITLHSRIIGRKILLHQPVAIAAGEVEEVVRIFVDQDEVVFHRPTQIFIDDLRIFPAPFGIKMRVAYGVQRRLFAQIGVVFRSLGRDHGTQCKGSKQSRNSP